MWRENPPGPTHDRGQVFTLEGVFAGLVILISVLLALQSVTVVPGGGGSASSGGNENVAQSALSAVDDRAVRTAVLYWSSDGFHCSPSGTTYYTGEPASSCGANPGNLPPTEFGAVLADQLGGQYQYNVVLRYGAASGSGIASQRMVYQGQPGEGAVRARTSVPLTDDEVLRDPSGEETSRTLSAGNFYATDSSTRDIYNLVHVEVVAWQS